MKNFEDTVASPSHRILAADLPPARSLETEAPPGGTAQRRVGIRLRIAFGFFICFFLALSISLASLWLVMRLQIKIQFLEITDIVTVEIQQARRFEKNFFLYGTNLDDAMSHVRTAATLVQANARQLEQVAGPATIENLLTQVRQYIAGLEKLQSGAHRRDPGAGPGRQGLETELRGHGAEMISLALNMAAKERQAIDALLGWAKQVPIYFLLGLVGVMIFLGHKLSRHILVPLTQLLKYTQRIAQGEFIPVIPAAPHRDEFADLTQAMNRMLAEIGHRQEIMVQSHKLRAIGTLTAGVAHELNNPVNNIMLTAHLLLEKYADYSDSERQEMIGDLITQAERSRRIISHLLDFARESESRLEPLEVGELVRETVRLAANQIKLARAELEMDFPDHAPRVHGDRQQLSQVILNIILNALDALPEGGRIAISLGQEEPHFLALKISDTGPGIPDHILPHIFDPFFTTKGPGQGTGLGLAVSQGIVARHGGEIQVSSTPGQGTTFTIILPITTMPS